MLWPFKVVLSSSPFFSYQIGEGVVEKGVSYRLHAIWHTTCIFHLCVCFSSSLRVKNICIEYTLKISEEDNNISHVNMYNVVDTDVWPSYLPSLFFLYLANKYWESITCQALCKCGEYSNELAGKIPLFLVHTSYVGRQG